ncbi:hypothetical protein PSP31121_05114 [Pandoraea sputorum]|uniref:Uncharacterized protein n=1 Tax=Pandoraea sputorum TaxID=93222 RepID=A0A5E5BLF1_9BURK|nr:hypothetical protein PSP31121_05114 [Pandoraea sputorum]
MRQNDIRMARVYLAQARQFRMHSAFHATLLAWAAARRRKAMNATGQMELFA